MTELPPPDAVSPAATAAGGEPMLGSGWAGAPKQKDRITLLDAARGLGVLGILPCNMPDFAYPFGYSDTLKNWPHGAGWETLTGWVVTQMFFQRRFVTLFSMMFGVSLFLVGGERTDKLRGLILRKRVLALLAIGIVHCLLVWWGDVLISYALAGLIMLLLRSLPPGRLLRTGLIIFGVFGVVYSGGLIAGTVFAKAPDPGKIRSGMALATAAYRDHGFLGSLVANAIDGLKAQTGQIFIVPWTLSLMCVGLASYKWGVFTGEAPRKVYLALLGGGAAALFAIVFAHAIVMASRLDQSTEITAQWLQMMLAPLNSLGYVALLFFALGSRVWRFIPQALAPVGQMAFTNYLTQSLMMTALFYGGRGPDLYGGIDRPGLWAICVAVWVLQIVWSRIWLTYFTMGPLEWGWRRLYRGPAPLRRIRSGPPALTAAPAL